MMIKMSFAIESIIDEDEASVMEAAEYGGRKTRRGVCAGDGRDVSASFERGPDERVLVLKRLTTLKLAKSPSRGRCSL